MINVDLEGRVQALQEGRFMHKAWREVQRWLLKLWWGWQTCCLKSIHLPCCVEDVLAFMRTVYGSALQVGDTAVATRFCTILL